MCYVPLLVGFATGFRRSELAALNRENIEFTEQGMVIHQRRSKTDQEGKGRRLDFWRGGALCPVRALEKWLKTANITSGAIFLRVHRSGAISGKAMSGESVAAVVKKYLALIGKDASLYGAHSLRRGLITSMAEAGANEVQIMHCSGHHSSAMVREYIEQAQLFHGQNVTALLGL